MRVSFEITGYRLALGLGVLLFLYTLFVTAWVGDDAYISFRVVDNFIHGYGLRWNIAERVWVYTNPLWVLLMSTVHFVTRELYYSSLALSAVISAAVLVLCGKYLSKTIPQVLIVAIIAIGSKAFTDYSTSGLENPLTHLLLVCFWVAWFTLEKGEKRFLWLSLWAALILINRMDTVMLVVPALVLASFDQPFRATMKSALLGFLPFILWELFALWYYGMPFPNTYYAKTHTGIASGALMSQSLHYFVDSFQRDPITLSVIAGGLLLGLTARSRERLVVVVGIVLSLLYTVRVGADFMSGRFFTAPLLCAILLIVSDRRLEPYKTGFVAVAAALFLAMLNPLPPMLSGSSYGSTPDQSGIQPTGIADERGWYYQSTGLLRQTNDTIVPNHQWYSNGLLERSKGGHVDYESCVGFVGVAAGPEVHIIDGYALTEPLYSHLPTEWRRGWRIGHFSRIPPEGYDQTVRSAQNQIVDSNLSHYYNKISLITRGSLFDINRLETIVLFNLGRFDHWLEAYTSSPPVIRTYSQVCTPRPVNTPWNDPGNIQTKKNGLRVDLEGLHRALRVEVSLDHNDDLFVIWYRGSTELGWEHLARRINEKGGLRYDTAQTPADALTGFDRLDIIPCLGDDLYSVGHVRLLDE